MSLIRPIDLPSINKITFKLIEVELSTNAHSTCIGQGKNEIHSILAEYIVTRRLAISIKSLTISLRHKIDQSQKGKIMSRSCCDEKDLTSPSSNYWVKLRKRKRTSDPQPFCSLQNLSRKRMNKAVWGIKKEIESLLLLCRTYTASKMLLEKEGLRFSFGRTQDSRE